MKILVTGREGQLVRSLLERGQSSPGLSLIALGRPELDLEDPASIGTAIARHSPDVVINAAAYTAVDRAEDEPEQAFRINGAAAGEVAAAARQAGARVIQISTDYVFDGRLDAPYAEDAPATPLGVYGQSKLQGEEMVRRENPGHAIVRTSWVYSPFGHNFLKTMMTLARARDTVSVVDDQFGSPSSALDLADGLLAMAAHWRQNPEAGLGETYHLAGTGRTSWFDFARHIFVECERLGRSFATVQPIPTEQWPTKAVRPKNSALDCSKFERDFGFRAPHWADAAARVVQSVAEREPRN